jgi:hypothetical protein
MYLAEMSTAMTLFCQKYIGEGANHRPMPAPRMANDLAVALGKTLPLLLVGRFAAAAGTCHRLYSVASRL